MTTSSLTVLVSGGEGGREEGREGGRKEGGGGGRRGERDRVSE